MTTWELTREPEAYILLDPCTNRMTNIPGNAFTGRTGLGQHSSATVYTQRPDNDHQIAVNLDAWKRSVSNEPGGWRVLAFHYVPSHKHNTYATLNVSGSEQYLAALVSPDCMPQLLPTSTNIVRSLMTDWSLQPQYLQAWSIVCNYC